MQREAERQVKKLDTAKEEVRKLLDRLPEDVSYEDIQYHIYVVQKIAEGLRAVEEGRVLTHEEVERRMAKWRGEFTG